MVRYSLMVSNEHYTARAGNVLEMNYLIWPNDQHIQNHIIIVIFIKESTVTISFIWHESNPSKGYNRFSNHVDMIKSQLLTKWINVCLRIMVCFCFICYHEVAALSDQLVQLHGLQCPTNSSPCIYKRTDLTTNYKLLYTVSLPPL